jgi:hypothetical protein
MKTTLTIIIALLTLTSCSVQKRMYSSGYNFTWNTNKHNTPKQNATATNNNQIEEIQRNDSIIKDDYVASTETKITVAKTEKISLTTVKKTKLNTVKNVVTKLDTVIGSEIKTIEPKQYPIKSKLASVSFALGFLSVIIPIVIMIGSLLSIAGLAFTSESVFLFLIIGLPIILAILSIVFGTIALIKHIKNMNKYSNIHFAIFGILLSLLLLGIFAALIFA